MNVTAPGAAAPSGLTPVRLLLAVAVMAVWGSNFVVIKLALADLPPLTFAALRFTFVAFPLVFLVKRPAVPWTNLAAYGLLIGVGQFGVLFIAMQRDITPGLASLVVQTQVVFTILLATFLAGERPGIRRIAALLLSASGIVLIAVEAGGSATPLGLALVLFAALSWSGGNMVGRRARGQSMLAYVVWSSLFASPALIALSLLVEGPQDVLSGIAGASLGTWAAVAWQSVGNSIFGYGVWSWLLSEHEASTIAPLALLVPVFGMSASALFLGEPLQPWKLIAAALVLSGLVAGLLAARRPRPALRGQAS